MKRSAFSKFSIFFLIILIWATAANAQWYLDTATPAEAAARDKPYQYLQNQIRKLCDNNWGTEKTDFKFFKDDPSWHKIVRGVGIHYFDFTGGGDACIIQMRKSSALYHDNLNNTAALTKSYDARKYGFSGPKYDEWNRNMQKLENDQEFAQIKMSLNDDRIQGKELQDYRTNKLVQLNNIPVIGQAFIYCEYPDTDDPDTSYRAALYLGNFPKYNGKMEGVHFKSYRKDGWKDKSHSGAPIVENISIWISSYHYNNLMKVLHTIDWTGLDSIVKNMNHEKISYYIHFPFFCRYSISAICSA